MKYFVLFGIMFFLIIAGCTSAPVSKTPAATTSLVNTTNCRMVAQEVPVTKEECSQVSITDPVCGVRKLNYTATELPKTDLCISEGSGCMGRPLSQCRACNNAMSRCILVINNTDQKSGAWTVAANYTLGDYGFNKDPISKTIAPGASFSFDFDQIYNPGSPIYSASCKLVITIEPTIEECREVTRLTTECRNVTGTMTTQKQVCD